MLDFSGLAFMDESFRKNEEGFEDLSWLVSSSAPSSVVIVKSSFLNYKVLCSQTSDSLILYSGEVLTTSYYCLQGTMTLFYKVPLSP